MREVFHPTQGSNRPKWTGPEADAFAKLVEDGALASDPDDRAALYFEAEKSLCVDNAVIIPIYYYTSVRCDKPYLERTDQLVGGQHIDKWKVHEH